eukprot:TRINITY_DN7189_c0_g1_i11.p1 TRINITY_DN7189_c0_g1~~TRINITY_DN7189_c0_g1_i11.p1  ORF type:complete len:425 (+),score=12.12 TRINITY_DN7189_c0_g1_i11:86-1360(+)
MFCCFKSKRFFVLLWLITVVSVLVFLLRKTEKHVLESGAVHRFRGLFYHGLGSTLLSDTSQCSFVNPACFDHARCSNFTISIYPDPPPKVQLINGEPLIKSEYFEKILAEIRRSRYWLADASQACLLVPSFDHTLVTSQLDQPYQIARQLWNLEFWNQGRNHLIFNKHDRGEIQMDIGYAIALKVGFSSNSYRPLFDISMPPPAAWMTKDRNISPIFGWPLRYPNLTFPFVSSCSLSPHQFNSSAPKYFLTFKGSMTYRLRHLFRQYDNDIDIIHRHKLDTSVDYRDLLLHTEFALCVRGNGFYSYRFTEAMASGAIPVIIGDQYVLPFSELINWSEFIVVIPEANYRDTIPFLRTISAAQRNRMRRLLYLVYMTFFRSIEQQVAVALELLKVRTLGYEAWSLNGFRKECVYARTQFEECFCDP